MSILMAVAAAASNSSGSAGESLPTSPLLLLHGDGSDGSTTFLDTSGEDRAVVAVNGAQVDTAQSKFGGASIKFERSNDDFLSVVDKSNDMSLDGEFTIAFWVRFATVSNTMVLVSRWDDSPGKSWHLTFDPAGGNLEFHYSTAGTSDSSVQKAWSPSADTWYHVAVTRNASNDLRMFIDGTQIGTTSAVSSSFFDTGTDVWIGSLRTGGSMNSLDGWMDEILIASSCVWDANFTPPTDAYADGGTGATADNTDRSANTILLLHGDGSDASTTFTDSSSVGRTVTVSGNAQLDTAQKKFGTASMLFDGTGDYGTIPDAADLSLNGQFTIEGWMRFNTLTDGQSLLTKWRVSGTTRAWGLRAYPTSKNIEFIYSTDGTTQETFTSRNNMNLAVDTWYHVAVTRDASNVIRMFLNGAFIGEDSSTNFYDNAHAVYLGALNNNGSVGSYMDGWLDDVRILNTCAYTETFMPPDAPFAD